MRYLVNGSQMKQVDSYNIGKLGIPSEVLMERAAYAVSLEAERLTDKKSPVLLVCGMGNNGADGLAVSRMLFLHGRKVEVLLVGEPSRATREHGLQLEIVRKLGIPVRTADAAFEYDREGRFQAGYDLIVDALFGVGLKRPIEGIYASVVEALNRSGSRILSVDIPSGISSETGQVLGAGVKADMTVTFGFEKLGMVFYPGCFYCGRRVVADIGFFLPEFMKKEFSRTFEKEDLKKIPERADDGNKGTFGRVLVAAGSKGMCGAAYMSALAACRMGAGLVQIYTVKENIPVLQTSLPEAVVTSYDPEYPDEEQVEGLLKWADVLVIGPGFSKEAYAGKLLSMFLEKRKIPTVIDADALNLISENRDFFSLLDENVILTPHVGEMARLSLKTVSEIKASPAEAAAELYEKYRAVCILKDARTVVSSGNGIYVNTSGNSGMATGGSGDVLSGLLGGLLAIGLKVEDAAELGVYVHGRAGDLAAEKYGKHGMLATDLIACLPGAIEYRL